MKNSKIIIIDKNGNLNSRGNLNDLRHSISLLNYIKEKYPEWSILKSLDITIPPFTLGTILTYANNIVFLNTTKNKVLSGVLLIGKNYNELQINSLKKLISEFANFNIRIISDIEIVEGEALGKDFYAENHESTIEMFERFLYEEGYNAGKIKR